MTNSVSVKGAGKEQISSVNVLMLLQNQIIEDIIYIFFRGQNDVRVLTPMS
jgi:hypothetical protein